MKYHLAILFAIIIGSASAQTPIKEHALNAGFYNKTYILRYLANGNHVVIGRGQATPGGDYTDSIFFAIITPQGTVSKRQTIAMPISPRLYPLDVVALPDAGFVVSISLESCDYGIGECVIQRYNAAGELVWTRQPPPNASYYTNMTLNALGNITCTAGYGLAVKVDVTTGAETNGYFMKSNYPYGVGFITDIQSGPVLDELIATGLPDLQRWRLYDISGVPEYRMVEYVDIPSAGWRKIAGKTQYHYYTFSNSALFRFSESFDYEQLATLPYTIKDVSIGNSLVYLLCRQGDTSRIVTTDYDGQLITDYPLPFDKWKIPEKISVKNGKYFLAGMAGSGPTGDIAPWQHYHASDCWIAVGNINDLTPQTSVDNDAAITGVIQPAPVWVDSFYSIGGDTTRYRLTGGDFSIQITNKGTAVLNEVDGLVAFLWNEDFFCSTRSAHRVHFSDLNLAPGTSMWLKYGDISADFQPYVSDSICFWLAAPNLKPDADHTNDVYCAKLSSAYPDTATSAGFFRVYPNPAHGWITVERPYDDLPEHWHLINSLGQQVDSGIFENGQSILTIETRGLTKGVYVLKLGKNLEKLVIDH